MESARALTRRSQHPVIRGMVCGALFVVVTTFLISFIPPAYAFSLPVGNLFVIDLGDLPPWIGVAVAFGVWWDARKAKKNAADAVTAATQAAATAALGRTEIKAVSVQIDGMLAQKKEADIKEGQRLEKIVGEEKAATLAQGQQEGREIERERAKVGGTLAVSENAPVPVVDDVAGTAAVKSATALESLAKSAKATVEEKKKD